jgi:trehalose/maltose hydrolase-like predicted phosphorylase
MHDSTICNMGFYSFLNLRITRALLLYQYRRLVEARAAARDAGYQGGMFPCQSGSNEDALLAGAHADLLVAALDEVGVARPASHALARRSS